MQPRGGPFSFSGRITQELLRWLVLLMAGAWLLGPFATTRMIGAGDAVWYSNMLADFVLQLRQGVFPVFVGQTEYAFNGAVYPLRVAPLYQHWAGAIDLLTGRTLSFPALHNAVTLTVGFVGIAVSYACVRALCPRQPWVAVALACIYLSCPAVLALPYTQDLIMSWIALPFLPLAFYGTVRSYRRDDLSSWFCLSAGLAALWLAHAPIALWATAVVGISQVVRLTVWNRTAHSAKAALGGAVLFAVLGSYPFVSMAALQAVATDEAVSLTRLPDHGLIMTHLKAAFPGNFMPLSEAAGALSDVQLGYALLALMVLSAAVAAARRQPAPALLLMAAGAFVVLTIPLPWPTRAFWLQLAPEPLLRLTFYWPMQRLLPVAAAGVVVAAGAAAGEWCAGRAHRQTAIRLILCACLGWSLWEAAEFREAARRRTSTVADTSKLHRGENVRLMNHAYGMLGALPPTFSHGVLDPFAELYLLDENGRPTRVTDLGGTVRQAGQFQVRATDQSGVFNLLPPIALQPGRRYDLVFNFGDSAPSGLLQLSGKYFYREYLLPNSGGPRGFGAAAGNGRSLPLWTSGEGEISVSLRYIAKTEHETPFTAGFELRERAGALLPAEVISLSPYRVRLRAQSDLLLETPRVYLAGYLAQVDGRSVPVSRSPAGLVAVRVPAGAVQMELMYHPPVGVAVSYWVTLLGWLTCGILAAWSGVRSLRRPQSAG